MPTAKKTATSNKTAKGDSYVCEVCGLSVIVDEACGCETCDIICCAQPMKAKKSKTAAK